MKTIFVSSTFQDMHFERDAIQELVYPKLNQIARRYGQSVSFCDLRWGIDTSELESESGSRKVLDVCLDEIDRCQPPMVVILGDRYGWIPSKELVEDTVRRYSLQLDDLQKSVTALEIEYGALGSSEKLRNTLFYFRSIEGAAPENYTAEDEAHRSRLQLLKDRIRELTGGRIRHYTLKWNGSGFSGIEDFAGMVTEDLQQVLLPGWERYSSMDPFRRELHTHTTYLREKEKMFRARESLVEQLLRDIRSGKKATLLKGEVGSGKSTLFSHLAVRLEQEGWEVFPLFSGLTAESNTAFGILKLTVRFLEDRLGLGHMESDGDLIVENAPARDSDASPEAEDAPDPVKRWRTRLNSLCTRCSASGIRLVLMLDAADQLFDDDARDKLVFIPEELSEQVRFIMTSLPELPLAGMPAVQIPPIREEDKRQVIDGILSAHNRELPKEVVSRMVSLPAADNPLYLSFLVQRLLMMNKADFDSIHRRGDGMAAIAAHQLSVIDSCPKSLQDMSAELIATAARRIGGQMVTRVLNYLALSQHGLRLTDLMGLLGSDFQMLDFTHFISYMADCFLLRDDGRYDFSHKSIREGLTERCGNKEALHLDIKNHLRSLDEEDEISKRELLHYAIEARDAEYFCRYIRYCKTRKDKSYAYHGAMNCYMACLRDGGQWVCSVLEQGENYPRAYHVANFIAEDFYAVAPGRMSEQDMLLKVVLAAKDLSERLFEANHKPESAHAVMNCCQALVGCYQRRNEGLNAYKAQIRKIVLAVTFERVLPSPEHRRDAVVECAKAVQMFEDWKVEERDGYHKLGAIKSFLMEHIKLRDPGDGKYTWYHVKTATMEYIMKVLQELAEEDPAPERKQDLADHYRIIASVVTDKTLAGSYYEQAIGLYRELAACKGEVWYRRMLVEVYGEYIKKLGSMYDEEALLQLREKRLQIMEELLEFDRSVDFRKDLAMSHRYLADGLRKEDREGTGSLILRHYQRALSLLESVAEERGTMWDLEELALLCEWLVLVDGADQASGGDIALCQKAIHARRQLCDRLGRSEDRKILFRLFRMVSSAYGDNDAGKQYDAMADELEKDPEVSKAARAYTEVLEVLRHMDKVYVEQIPKWFILKLLYGCSYSYDFRMTKSFAEEKLSEDTLAILAIINNNYWKEADIAAPKWNNISQLLAMLKLD